MLKHRIITAALLIPSVLLLLFFAPPWLFVLVTSLIILIAAWEWTMLIKLNHWRQQAVYLIIITIAMMVSYSIPLLWCLWLACLWWLFALLLVLRYPRNLPRNLFTWQTNTVIQAIMGLFILVLCWRALNVYMISLSGRWQLFTLFILIWGADASAYFAGQRWGRNKLAAAVSPGKTWQGFIAAMVFACCFAIVYAALQWNVNKPYMGLWLWFAVIIIMFLSTTAISVVGDLTESMLKRHAKVKDSSRLLPGHGGFLDRIDSLTAAAPIFLLWLLYLNLFIVPHGGTI